MIDELSSEQRGSVDHHEPKSSSGESCSIQDERRRRLEQLGPVPK